MNNVTTPETSQRLKAAGFPQPVPEFGQVWYDDLNRPVMVRATFPEYVSFCVLNSLENMSADNEFVKNHCCFAPTATDILRELSRWQLDYSLDEWRLINKDGYFASQRGANPAELGAKVYLSLHEKTEQNEL